MLYIYIFKLFLSNLDDPLANDVAQHWKENETAAVATGINLLLFFDCTLLP